ncbi:MAG: protein CrcB, partial [Lactobacillus iners]|nr:protein CrcB [Lactobacillus iners]
NKQYLIFISYFVLTYLGGFTLLLIGYILAK